MSRPLRIEYPGAWYHVMNRGRRKEDIFLDQDDYSQFLEVLKEASRMWNLRVSAYCLMSNHYHLLIQTPDGNLSRCMRHINGVYTQRFNRKHELDGQLFRGRYKAVLVEEDEHLIELLRYIHRNPIRANMVDDPEDYKWSSHRDYLDLTQTQWLYRDNLLNMFSASPKRAHAAYRDFVQHQDSAKVEHFYTLRNLPSIFGSDGFIDRVRQRLNTTPRRKDVPQAAILAVNPSLIDKAVRQYYQISRATLLTSHRGKTNSARDLALYLLRRYTRKTLTEIGRYYDIANYSTVSSAIVRAQKAIRDNETVRRDYGEIENILSKGQSKT